MKHGMRHLLLYHISYMIFVYPTLKLYIIIALNNSGKSAGQFEKDVKVRNKLGLSSTTFGSV